MVTGKDKDGGPECRFGFGGQGLRSGDAIEFVGLETRTKNIDSCRKVAISRASRGTRDSHFRLRIPFDQHS